MCAWVDDDRNEALHEERMARILGRTQPDRHLYNDSHFDPKLQSTEAVLIQDSRGEPPHLLRSHCAGFVSPGVAPGSWWGFPGSVEMPQALLEES